MTLRIGVVGTAHWAEHTHLPGLRLVPEVEVAGLWGRNPERAGALAKRYGISAFASFEELLASVDAVSFAVPPAVQAVLALRAAEAGRHLLLEKPVACTREEADAIVDALGRRGLASVVFLTRRFIPEVAAAISDLSTRRWTGATVSVLGGALTPGSPYEGSLWRHERDAVVWDLGPHVLSVLHPMLGRLRQLRLLAAGDAESTLRSEHESGAEAVIRLSARAPVEQQGSAYAFHSAAETMTLPDPPIERPAIFAHAVRDLRRAIRSGEASPCDARFGAEITRDLVQALQ